MPVADLIRRESDAWSRIAVDVPDEGYSKHARMVAVILRNIAGVVEVHGLPGLHGYMACRHFSTPVTDSTKKTVQAVIERILRGESH